LGKRDAVLPKRDEAKILESSISQLVGVRKNFFRRINSAKRTVAGSSTAQ
jgi:hypothetical protein